MRTVLTTRRRLAALAFALTAGVACATTEVVGPPDAIACTSGTLRPSADLPDTVSGLIDASRCLRFSALTLEDAHAESWTLALAPFTAYVVRLVPQETTPGVVPLTGTLSAIARNAQGDPGIVARGRASKDDDIGNTEMVLAVAEPRTISIRVEGLSIGDRGPYRLAVAQCPVRELPLDSTVTDVSTINSCLARGWATSARRLTFASVAIERQGVHRFSFERTDGSAAIRSLVTGPDIDVHGLDERSPRFRAPVAGARYELNPLITVPGRYTFVFESHPDSSATMQLRAGGHPMPDSLPQP